MTKRKIEADFEDFKKCLTQGAIPIKSLSEKFAEQVRALVMGSFVIFLKGYENDYIKKLVVVMWRCRGDAVNCLVNQAELDGMKSKVRSLSEEEYPVKESTPTQAKED
jgi:hypothetical protein